MDWPQQLVALAQVIFIDLVLAGDNAVVVGMAASRVAPELRARVILWGVAGAVVVRVLFAIVATHLLAIIGLTLAGGILLLWVCWKMFREIQHVQPEPAAAGVPGGRAGATGSGNLAFRSAIIQIVVADVSMSLDNVLAVAGAAKGHTGTLIVGLALSIAFMALVSAWIARVLARYRWVMWIGLLIVLHVAIDMIWNGSHEVGCRLFSSRLCETSVLTLIAQWL